GGAQFLDNEVPGAQMDRLTPHMAETARRLWILYIAASALLFLIFLALYYTGVDPLMDPFQSIAHTFTTLPSGGFSPQGRSVEAFSAAVQWVMIPFMFVAGMNFVLLWRALFVGPGTLFENTEFKVYLTLFISAGVLLGLMLGLHGQFTTAEENLRHGVFQVATVLTSTGFASTDFALWSGDILGILFVLMFVCGCVGSTSGGLKVLRWVVAIKVVVREMFQQIHSSSIRPLRMGERVLKESVVRGALILIVVYLALFGVSVILIAINIHFAGIEMETIDLLSAVAATLGNVGPGLGVVGPMESFEFLPDFTKAWICLLMIAGRLEIMTFLVLLTPTYWRD
ncbi:MAG: TrkH family potassium uptake protein, partial [Bradymonadaceae bacterium]